MLIPEDFYRSILRVLPVHCVDILLTDASGQVLLVKRRNEPARGLWWFPGGRVHFGERRQAAAARKLREECGLALPVDSFREMLTEDLLLPDGAGGTSHTITTLYRAELGDAAAAVTLDSQSDAAAWRGPRDWLDEGLAPFVDEQLRALP